MVEFDTTQQKIIIFKALPDTSEKEKERKQVSDIV